MMSEHVHVWSLGEWLFQPTTEEMNNFYAICVKEHCAARLEKPDIESMLNKHATLKKRLAKEIRRSVDFMRAGSSDALKRENDGLKNNLRVIQSVNDELRDTVKAQRKLAYDYIQAYEKLAFGDAILAQEQDRPNEVDLLMMDEMDETSEEQPNEPK